MDERLSFFFSQEDRGAQRLNGLSKQICGLAKNKTLSPKTSVYPAASPWGSLVSKGPMLTQNIQK